MREVAASAVRDAVARLCVEANVELGEDVYSALERAVEGEESPGGREILEQILENARIAKAEDMPMCQDTGYAVVFVQVGQDVAVTGGGLTDAIDEGVRRGYGDGYLRKSILSDPIKRVNTKDNTPAAVHYDVVPGDKLTITVAPKGGGSENMSRVAMLKPLDGIEGVKSFVVDAVRAAGGNPCPPVVVGVGIGGTFEKCAFLAKKALLREVGSKHGDEFYAAVEADLLERVNKTGVGPMGLGGRTTAIAVHVETAPCHLASLPVAVNINCHAARHASAAL